ncbi:uncharacterized protein LOC131021015 [Salvia miltiorrhiza]|uniref:uncharacterized protein LOC131021015 n=1 Tax=Salvia miltiorrhiza TaxID=226208 RepID=UPI0025AC19BD|nr:uncharacterized protein LOC131021015 [Salvia miltiorrhiza]
MALTRNLILLVSTTICIFASTSKYGRAYDGDRLGAAEVIADDFVPEAGAEEGEGEDEGHDHPDQVFMEALECFNDRNIYSGCAEEYRLTRHGELHVPRDCADQYCEGPCRKETNLVLECIDEILHHFRFYNKATVGDVRETINAACSYGPKRGDFNVLEHVRVDEDISSKLMCAHSSFHAAVLMMLGWHVLF